MYKKFTGSIFLSLIIFSAAIFAQKSLIIKQPASAGVIEGQTATFSVKTDGEELMYQWYRNGIAISGATENYYTTPPSVLNDNGSEFYVEIKNSSGSYFSSAAKLFVTDSRSRVGAGQIVLYTFNEAGGTTIFDSSGVGSPLNLNINDPSLVSWSPVSLLAKDTALINSPAPASKIIDSVTSANEVSVEMWINPLEIRNDRIFAVTQSSIDINLAIESIPTSGFNFVVRTTNTNPQGIPGVQDSTGLSTGLVHLVCTFENGVSKIYKNGTEVASANIGGNLSNWNNSARLSLANYLNGSKPWKGIFYLAAVYNRALDSAEVVQNFNMGVETEQAPFIVEEPQSLKVVEGITATFKVRAIGNSPLSYQWKKDGVDIPGAVDTFYTTPPLTVADNGSVYTVEVTNSEGSDVSADAVLEVVEGNLAGCVPAMVHYYKLEENTPPYFDSYGFTNALSSNPPVSQTGLVGNSLFFSSQETINVPDDNLSDWQPNESFTVQFWMKTDFIPSISNVAVGRDDSSSDLHWWVGYNSNGRAAFQLRDKDGSGPFIGDAGPVVNDNNWHLITAVRNGDQGRNYLYVDGSVVDSADFTYNASFESSTNINIGWLNLSPFYYFNGSLDEIAFINSALSGSDIQTHYQNGLAGLGYCSNIISGINAPGNLIALRNTMDSTTVDLFWDDNSDNELGFVIERALGDSLSAVNFLIVDTTAANVTFYNDITTLDTTTYTYRVYAFNADTVSAYSNLAEITTALPVELTSFVANVVNGKVIITWETASEINNKGFFLERSRDNQNFSELIFIGGKGTTTNSSEYSYSDNSVLSGIYYYRLRQIDFDGSYYYSESIEIDLGIPVEFSLEQNYPNPFNPATTIRFSLPLNANVNIKLYNTLGEEISEILKKDLDAGVHEIFFNAAGLSSGIYFYRLNAEGSDGSVFSEIKRMVFLK